MRILLSSDHKYPALVPVGSGLHPKEFPSGSGYLIHDLLARGLAELGHDVFYLVRDGFNNPAPPGVTLVSRPIADEDILHVISDRDKDLVQDRQASGRPWVATCHLDLRARGLANSPTTENWIFVSRTLAQLLGCERYVWNGINPEEYVFSETKDDYLLFMSTMDWGTKKGLDIVLSLSKELGFKLVVAGTGESYERIATVQELCRQVNATYVGDVRGKEKAELLAGAKAFLFPTKVDEAFGLGMVEALMSGTPVICSDRGACPEVITPEVGFVCRNLNDYVAAVGRIGEISPLTCREKALKDYHYLKMSAAYVAEYQKEIERNDR
jgi:glycosyltransferase involved in cell wall biosynthesis